MVYNYRALIGKIIEVYGSQKAFAKAFGVSEHTLSVRLNNLSQWKQRDISKAAELLQINADDIPLYFFAIDVQAD